MSRKRQIGSAVERPKGSGRWRLKWYDSEEDKYFTTTVSAKNETEARKMLVTLMNQPVDREPKQVIMTVQQLLEKYLEDYSTKRLRRTTLQRYRAIINNDLIPKLGNMEVEKITPSDISEYYGWALDHGRKDGRGGLSAQTVHHIHNLLHRAFALAKKRKWISRNPADDVEAPQPDPVEMQTLDADHIVELLELVRGTQWEIPVMIGAFTGMRRGEILGLRWDCVDLERKTITVIRSLEEVKEGIFMGDTKTSSSRRAIPIADMLATKLAQHRTDQNESKCELGELYDDQGFVCALDDGTPIRPKNLTAAFRDIIDNSGLPRVRFHDLSRHTPATIMLENGENAKVVQEHLGHANYGVTMDVYSHVTPRMSRDAIDRYDKVISDALARRNVRKAKSNP